MTLNAARKEKALFFGVILFFGLAAFTIGMAGYSTTPLFDEKYGIYRCLDWKFHACLSESAGDLTPCNVFLGFFGTSYAYYPPFIHLLAFGLSQLAFSTVFWLSVVIAACMSLLAALLYKHGGLASVLVFFLGIPLALWLGTGLMPFAWIDLAGCGIIPFLVACTIFVFLLLEHEELPFSVLLALFIAMALVHNYGWVLNCLLLVSGAFSWYLARGQNKLTIVTLVIVFAWLITFSHVVLVYSNERIVFLFYFLVSLELGKLYQRFKH